MITRISYRHYLNNRVRRGEIPLNSPLNKDVFQFVFKNQVCNHENFSLTQLIDNATNALTHSRMGQYIQNYQSIILPKLHDFNAHYEAYQKANVLFEDSKFLDLSFGQKALAFLQEALLILNDIKNLVSSKKPNEELVKLKSKVVFASIDNMQAFRDTYPKPNNHILVQYFLDNKLTLMDDLSSQIQSIYKIAMMAGALDLVQYIYKHFYIKSEQDASSQQLLNCIEANKKPQDLQQKHIDVSNFLFEYTVHHRKAVIERLGLGAKPKGAHPDTLTQMNLNDNFLSFLMYVNYAKFFPQFDWDDVITKITPTPNNAKYINALEEARLVKP